MRYYIRVYSFLFELFHIFLPSSRLYCHVLWYAISDGCNNLVENCQVISVTDQQNFNVAEKGSTSLDRDAHYQ